jgi:hypothetical protein
MEEQSEAAIKIQAHLRGFVLRKKYSVEQFTRKSIAASKIQSMYKSRSKVKKAKATLAVKKVS